MQKQLTPDAASSTKATLVTQSADISHPQVGSLPETRASSAVPHSAELSHQASFQQETRATTLQLAGNDFPVRITSTPDDYIGPSIQIAVAILSAAASAMVIIWQMRRQKKQADKQHVKTVQAELRLDAYRDYLIVNRNFSETQTINTQILLMRSAFSGAIEQYQNICFQSPLIPRTPAFMEVATKHIKNAIALVFFLERYESLLPRFEVYKLALNAALHEINKVYSQLFPVLLKWLPIDNPNFDRVAGAPAFLQIPIITDEALSEFNQAAAPIEKALGQLECWTSDLAVDLQNYLLGEYADQKVKKREPIDIDTYFIISIEPDKSVELARYFNEETEWGRSQSLIKQEVTANMKIKVQ